jgi:hypothetical protein
MLGLGGFFFKKILFFTQISYFYNVCYLSSGHKYYLMCFFKNYSFLHRLLLKLRMSKIKKTKIARIIIDKVKKAKE